MAKLLRCNGEGEYMIALLGIAVVVVGFLIRINPLLVIAAAVLATGWAAGFDIVHTLSVLGHAFNQNRYVSGTIIMVLPVIGLLERAGLQERARMLIAGLRGATVGRLLIIYMLFRQAMSAIGLAGAVGGHPQVVRPLLAPMAEAAAEKNGPLTEANRNAVRAFSASVDNIGAFFGEDVFLAMSSVLLIKGFLEQNHIIVQPLAISLWSIPTAIAAALIHGARLMLLDRKLKQSPPPRGEVDNSRSEFRVGGSAASEIPPPGSLRSPTSPRGGGDFS
jgi:uncharacterized membrane protein